MRKKYFAFALLLILSGLTTTAMSPSVNITEDAPPCTSTHVNPLLSTGPLSVLNCQSVTIFSGAMAHCNAIGSYGYRFVISNGSYSKAVVTHVPNITWDCHDLKCGLNTIKLYYRSSPGGSWSEYAQGGIMLSDCGI